jgi:hypothetical protein
VRAVGLRDKVEQRRRVKAGASGAAWEAQALAELREVGRQEADEDGEQTGTPGDP